jgi:hypothetical protein
VKPPDAERLEELAAAVKGVVEARGQLHTAAMLRGLADRMDPSGSPVEVLRRCLAAMAEVAP